MSEEAVAIRDFTVEAGDDLRELAIFYHNQFLDTASHNWFSQSIKREEPILPFAPTLSTSQSTRLLFNSSVIASTLYAGGKIKIIHPINEPDTILGAILLLAPELRFFPVTLYKLYQTGFLKLIWKWGYEGTRRLLLFESEVERMAQEAFQEMSKRDHSSNISREENFPVLQAETRSSILKAEDALFIVLLAVKDSERGKGYAKLLIEEGEKLAPAAPVFLDTSDTSTMLTYKMYGFEVANEGVIARGECDKDGYKSNSYKEGLPMYVMIKWKSTSA